MQAPSQQKHIYRPLEKEVKPNPVPVAPILPKIQPAPLLPRADPKPREYESDVSEERYSYKPIRSASRNSGANQAQAHRQGKRPWSGARPNSGQRAYSKPEPVIS